MLDTFDRLLFEGKGPVLLSTHEHPDADAAGALLALGTALHALGREVRAVLSPGLPFFLSFMDPDGFLEAFEPEGTHRELPAWASTWVLVDASDPGRLGRLEPAFAASKALKLCLDHHMGTPQAFDHAHVDPSAAASCELVHALLRRRLCPPFPPPIAQALYAGLADDTGNFRFSNSSPRAHRVAADLLEMGVDPARTYQALYHQGRPERLKVQGRAFSALRFLHGQTYACMALSRADLDACGATHDDLEGLVNKPLELKGVEVSALLYELPDGRWKASLRSRERVDVNAVCRGFGGGGHRLASGAKLDGPLETAENVLDAAVLAQLREDLPNA